MSQKEDSVLSFVHGSVFTEDSPYWNQLVYMLPGAKLK